ncbi:hypothetical protein MKW98_009914, partial [Papaver atlanticum]
MAFILIGAKALFYPTLLYNVVRNKMQLELRWWDCVDEFILLGAVPFPTDGPRLKQLGVHGVIILNESYETLAYEIDHLVLPTRDYLFGPSYDNICHPVDFFHRIVTRGIRVTVARVTLITVKIIVTSKTRVAILKL